MCGRFAFFSPVEAVAAWFPVDTLPALSPRYNIAPSQSIAVLRGGTATEREIVLLRWGLVPSWAKDPALGNRLINARAETVTGKPAFRAAFRRRRCVIPADGFYEWQTREAAPKQPWFISGTDPGPLLLAGIWEHWEKGAEPLQSCAIITTAADTNMQRVHHRMPLMLAREDVPAWLATDDVGAAVEQLTRPAPALQMHRVSRAVNSPAHEGANLIAPLSAENLETD